MRRLGKNLKAMAYAEDGLIEAYYKADAYCPTGGRFLVGLQFHPERMRILQDAERETQERGGNEGGVEESGQLRGEEFEYPECPVVYRVSSPCCSAYSFPQHSSCDHENSNSEDVLCK